LSIASISGCIQRIDDQFPDSQPNRQYLKVVIGLYLLTIFFAACGRTDDILVRRN
jgi:hypothetical protein